MTTKIVSKHHSIPKSTTSHHAKVKPPVTATKHEATHYLRSHHLKPTHINIKSAKNLIIKDKKKGNGPGGYDVTVRDAAADWQIIYGKVRVGGVMTFVHTTNSNQNLHTVITLAANQCQAIDTLYLDGEAVTFDSLPGFATGKFIGRVYMDVTSLGSLTQPTNAQLNANVPGKWTANHRQRGCCYAYVMFQWDQAIFPSGMPEITFDVRGKLVYDSRTTLTGYSNNAALCLADYLMDTRYGLGIPLSDIDTTALNTAANICDESVTKQDGTTEARYTINGAFHTTDEPLTVINKMLSSMHGYLVYVGGKWKILAGKYRSPSISLDETDLRSSLALTLKQSKRDVFNGVKGTYLAPEKDWQESDFPTYKNSYYKGLDNNIEATEDVTFPFTTSPSQAQRLAKISLERARQEIEFEADFSLKAYQLEPGDTVQFSYARFGWSLKLFEVIRVRLNVVDDSNGIPCLITTLHLKESASGVWDWNNGDETRVDLAPNTTLPDPFTTTAPTGLTLTSGTTELYIRSDGTVFSRIKASWTAMSDYFVSSGGRIEVQYKQSSAGSWSNAASVTGDTTFTHVLDVQDGANYDVRIRAVSALGVASAWTTVTGHKVIGKTAPPSNITGLVAAVDDFGIKLTWNAIPDLDVSQYEVRIGAAGDTWAASTYLTQTKATNFRYELKVASSYTFRVKAIDTSGNYSTAEVSAALTIAKPSAVAPSSSFAGPDLVLKWTASVGQFAIANYEIYYGDTFSGSTFVGNVKGLSFSQKVQFGGFRRFWIVARDVAGNLGTEANVDVTVVVPTAVQSLFPEVIDNNVLLKWSAPSAASLPIDHYKVYKGAVFGSATLLGQVTATFALRFESLSGTYVYWIVPYDTALNAGTPFSVSTIVNEPPDYVLQDNQILDLATFTLVNAFVENGYLIIPADPTETYANHFTANGWSTWQDAINAGATYYINNVPTIAYAEKVIDYGAVFASMIVKFSFVQENIVGSLAFNTRIGYSADGTNYTYQSDVTQIFAQNFRYIKVRISTGAMGGNSGEGMGVLGLTYP